MQKLLGQLKTALPSYPHEMKSQELIIDMEKWREAGRPYLWSCVDQSEDYTVWYDSGYGYLALFANGELVNYSNNNIIVEQNVIVLDKDVYNTNHYIFIPAE